MRIAAAFSWLRRGIDPAGLAAQLLLTLGALALAGWGIAHHGMPKWVAPTAFIIGNGLGAIMHARWAVAERSLPAGAKQTFLVRAEALTLMLSILLIEGVGALPGLLGAQVVTIAASARLAFGIAAAFIVGHALLEAPAWFASRELTGDPEARVQIPRRPPRLRLRSRSGSPNA
jgi:hypothetical protein